MLPSTTSYIGYVAHSRKHKILRKTATLLVASKGYLDQLWCMKPCKSSHAITELVSNHVRAGWQQINGIATYRRFNDNRGQCTLRHHGLLHSLGWSLQRPFDESVLLWHLATDFCFHRGDTPPGHDAADHSREMSNYMAYLLFVNPEMLMPGARRSLFRAAYKKLKDIPVDERLQLGERELTRNIIGRVTMDRDGSGVVHDAWRIACELVSLQQQWTVIQGVWVEMLCFAAARCRGYLHAKSLGKGGEYLSHVWLLLSLMGMETLAERMQRTELQEERDEGASGGGLGSASPVPAVGPGSTSPALAAGPRSDLFGFGGGRMADGARDSKK